MEEVIEKNKNADIEFPKEWWKDVSKEALDLTLKMTAQDQYNRLSSKECLEHPWFTKKFENCLALKSVQKNLLTFDMA